MLGSKVKRQKKLSPNDMVYALNPAVSEANSVLGPFSFPSH